jgi:hypothetical protein
MVCCRGFLPVWFVVGVFSPYGLMARGLRRLGDASLWCSSHAESTRGMTRLLSFSPLELFSGVPVLTEHTETNRSKHKFERDALSDD